MSVSTELTRDDIMPMSEYVRIRKERRREIVALKRSRQMEIGPVAVCHFESFDSMWQHFGRRTIASQIALLKSKDPSI